MKTTTYTPNSNDLKISDFMVIDGVGLCENTHCAPCMARVYASKITVGYRGRIGDLVAIPNRKQVRDAVSSDWDFFNVSNFGIDFNN